MRRATRVAIPSNAPRPARNTGFAQPAKTKDGVCLISAIGSANSRITYSKQPRSGTTEIWNLIILTDEIRPIRGGMPNIFQQSLKHWKSMKALSWRNQPANVVEGRVYKEVPCSHSHWRISEPYHVQTVHVTNHYEWTQELTRDELGQWV
jgi:hypothetical protein